MEEKFEINVNLDEYLHFEIFEDTIINIRKKYQELFGKEVLDRIPLYVDNCGSGSGYTPIISLVLNKFMIIKLRIGKFNDTEEITYQFAHEMCHFTYRCLIGIEKKDAEEYEESICTAMSLCFLNGNSRNFRAWCNHVKKLKYEGYRKGYDVALECDFDPVKLRDKILAELDEYRKVAL